MFNLKPEKLFSICSDGAKALKGSNKSAITKLNSYLNSFNENREIIDFQCIIHQENLVAKNTDIDNIIRKVIEIVNLLKKNSLLYRKFQKFLRYRFKIYKCF